MVRFTHPTRRATDRSRAPSWFTDPAACPRSPPAGDWPAGRGPDAAFGDAPRNSEQQADFPAPFETPPCRPVSLGKLLTGDWTDLKLASYSVHPNRFMRRSMGTRVT